MIWPLCKLVAYFNLWQFIRLILSGLCKLVLYNFLTTSSICVSSACGALLLHFQLSCSDKNRWCKSPDSASRSCVPSYLVVLSFSSDALQWLLARGRYISSQRIYVLLCVTKFCVRSWAFANLKHSRAHICVPPVMVESMVQREDN